MKLVIRVLYLDVKNTLLMNFFKSKHFLKAGVFAVRAGPVVKENLLSYLLNQPLTPHDPQKEFMALISTGGKYVVASRGNHALEGEFLWRLKDEIDRTWMNMYQSLPSMEEMENMDDGDTQETRVSGKDFVPLTLSNKGPEALAAFVEAPMRCGGCGAKVGSRTLSRVLDRQLISSDHSFQIPSFLERSQQCTPYLTVMQWVQKRRLPWHWQLSNSLQTKPSQRER